MLSTMLYNCNSLLSFLKCSSEKLCLEKKNMKKFGDQLNDIPLETSWLVMAMTILYHLLT